MSDPVEIQQLDGILIIAINRPLQRNAVNRAVSLAIATAVDRLVSDPELRVGIITGHGGYFCAGMDLKAFADGERPEIEGRGFAGLTEAPPEKPLIAAVEGFALAGGCELALTCDLIVAAETAWFGLPEVQRGLVAGSGGLVRLPRRIPEAIALEYALTGERMDANTAHKWGLVNRVTKEGAALDGAIAMAKAITANAPLSIAMTKRIVREAPNWAEAEIWTLQRPLVDLVIGSEDALEGARAFSEKRAPQWKGR